MTLPPPPPPPVMIPPPLDQAPGQLRHAAASAIPVALSQLKSKTRSRQLRLIVAGLMGSGKSTLCCMLAKLLGGTWVNQDEFSHSAKKAFLAEIGRAASDKSVSVLIVDKINLEKQHRREILDAMESGVAGDIVLLQLRHPQDQPESFEQQVKLCLSRIQARGGSHRTLTGSDPNLQSILRMTVRDIKPMLPEEVQRFKLVCVVDMVQTPVEMVQKTLIDLSVVDLLGSCSINELLVEQRLQEAFDFTRIKEQDLAGDRDRRRTPSWRHLSWDVRLRDHADDFGRNSHGDGKVKDGNTISKQNSQDFDYQGHHSFSNFSCSSSYRNDHQELPNVYQTEWSKDWWNSYPRDSDSRKQGNNSQQWQGHHSSYYDASSTREDNREWRTKDGWVITEKNDGEGSRKASIKRGCECLDDNGDPGTQNRSKRRNPIEDFKDKSFSARDRFAKTESSFGYGIAFRGPDNQGYPNQWDVATKQNYHHKCRQHKGSLSANSHSTYDCTDNAKGNSWGEALAEWKRSDDYAHRQSRHKGRGSNRYDQTKGAKLGSKSSFPGQGKNYGGFRMTTMINRWNHSRKELPAGMVACINQDIPLTSAAHSMVTRESDRWQFEYTTPSGFLIKMQVGTHQYCCMEHAERVAKISFWYCEQGYSHIDVHACRRKLQDQVATESVMALSKDAIESDLVVLSEEVGLHSQAAAFLLQQSEEVKRRILSHRCIILRARDAFAFIRFLVRERAAPHEVQNVLAKGIRSNLELPFENVSTPGAVPGSSLESLPDSEDSDSDGFASSDEDSECAAVTDPYLVPDDYMSALEVAVDVKDRKDISDAELHNVHLSVLKCTVVKHGATEAEANVALDTNDGTRNAFVALTPLKDPDWYGFVPNSVTKEDKMLAERSIISHRLHRQLQKQCS